MPFNDDEISQRITGVFRRVLRQPELTIRSGTTAADVKGWDSLSHINLIAAIEKEFKVRFTTGEIMGLRNVGDLETIVRKKSQGL